MAEFDRAFFVTMKNEGAYSNHKADSGGETYMGISRNNFPDWAGWKIIDTLDNKNSLVNDQKMLGLVKDFYKRMFWDTMKLDSCDSNKMAVELFDTAVNAGVGTASKYFQRVLNVINTDNHGRKLFTELTADGVVGLKTITSFNLLDDSHQDICFKLFNCLQGCHYISICESNPSQKIFMTGWSTRISF